MQEYQPRDNSLGIEDWFSDIPPDAVDLLKRMLLFNPNKRITIKEAIDHPFFNDVRDPTIEALANKTLVFDFENEPHLYEHRLRHYFLREVQRFHPEVQIPSPPSNIRELVGLAKLRGSKILFESNDELVVSYDSTGECYSITASDSVPPCLLITPTKAPETPGIFPLKRKETRHPAATNLLEKFAYRHFAYRHTAANMNKQQQTMFSTLNNDILVGEIVDHDMKQPCILTNDIGESPIGSLDLLFNNLDPFLLSSGDGFSPISFSIAGDDEDLCYVSPMFGHLSGCSQNITIGSNCRLINAGLYQSQRARDLMIQLFTYKTTAIFVVLINKTRENHGKGEKLFFNGLHMARFQYRGQNFFVGQQLLINDVVDECVRHGKSLTSHPTIKKTREFFANLPFTEIIDTMMLDQSINIQKS